MEILPMELLIQIFGYLCFHCQHPGLFPHANTDEIRANKKLLARLCRVSKRIRAIAQPILYHYYASGNVVSGAQVYEERSHFYDGGWVAERDYLPQFLRTVLRRPDLASQVVTMQLTQSRYRAGLLGCAQARQVLGIKALLDNGLRELLDEVRPPTDSTSIPEASETVAPQWPTYFDHSPESWLVTLAPVLTPRLESLLLATDNDAAFRCLEHSPQFKFPHLRILGLMGYRFHYHFNELSHLYAAAPNLRTIYATDAAGCREYMGQPSMHYYSSEYTLALGNLRKLAITRVSHKELGNVLRCLPKLEDLEYYWHYDSDGDMDDRGMFQLQPALQPVSKTLKRLGLSYLPERHRSDPARIALPFSYESVIQTLRNFGRLEELMLDCRSIYLESELDVADRLVTLLPPSIKSLRLAYLFMGMEQSLTRLALDAPTKFPDLKKVHVGFAELAGLGRKDGIAQTRTVDWLFAKAGVELIWSEDLLGAHGRDAIPGIKLYATLVPVPTFEGFRDGSEVRFDSTDLAAGSSR